MYRDKIFHCPLYTTRICIIISNDNKKINKKYNLNIEEDIYAWTVQAGLKIKGEKGKATCIFIILNPKFNFSDIQMNPGTVAHECFHATSFILDIVGVKADHNNGEAQAYLLGYLVQEVTEFLESEV